MAVVPLRSATANGSNNTGFATSFATLPIAGNAVFVLITDTGSRGVVSVVDNQGVGNTYTQLVFKNDSNNGVGNSGWAAIYWCQSIGATSGTFTVTLTVTNQSGFKNGVVLLEASGTAASADKTGSVNDGGTSPVTLTVNGSAQNSNAYDLVLYALWESVGPITLYTAAATAGYTSPLLTNNNSNGLASAAGYKLVSALETSQAVSQTATTGGLGSAVLATVAAASQTGAQLAQPSVWFDPHSTVGSVNRTFNSNVTSGNCLICVIAAPAAGKTWTVSDTVNGAWGAAAYTGTGFVNHSIQVFAFPNTAAGVCTITATQTSGTNGMQITIYEVVGLSGVVDQSISAHGATAANLSIGPTSALAAANEFVVCVAELNAASSGWSSGGSYSLQSSGSTSNGSSYAIPTGTGAQTGSFAWTTTEPWSSVVVAFALGSPPVTVPYMPYSSTQFIVQDRVIVS